MMYYRLLFEGRLFDVDVICFFVITVILGFVSFFLIRDYVRAKTKYFFGPTGKLVAGIICGAVGLLHFPLAMLILVFEY